MNPELARFQNFLRLEQPPWICVLFAERAEEHQAVMTQLQGPEGGAAEVELMPPCTAEEALTRLVTTVTDATRVLWLTSLFAEAGREVSFGARALAAWRAFLPRLNERRQVLQQKLRGGLVLPVPAALKSEIQQLAPDLWSRRGIVLDFLPELPPEDGHRLEDLFLRLQDLFTGPELARVIRAHAGPGALTRLPPAENVSLAVFAEQVVDLLRRDGLLKAPFFELLLRERPAQGELIVSLAARFGVGLRAAVAETPVHPAPVEEPHGDGWVYIERAADPIFRRLLRDIAAGGGQGSLIVAGLPKCGKRQLWQRHREVLEAAQIPVVQVDLLRLSQQESAGGFYRELARLIVPPLTGGNVGALRKGNEERELTTRVSRALREQERPVVLFFSSAEAALETSYGESFFSMVRHWHGLRADDDVWRRVHVLLLSSLPPAYFLTTNPHISPFNTAETVLLGDFTRRECERLWHAYLGQDLGAAEIHDRLTRGHPLLTQQAARAIKLQGVRPEDLLARGATHEVFQVFLQTRSSVLDTDLVVREAFRRVLQGLTVPEVELRRALYRRGLIRGDLHNLEVRCPLIRDYFRRLWRLDK